MNATVGPHFVLQKSTVGPQFRKVLRIFIYITEDQRTVDFDARIEDQQSLLSVCTYSETEDQQWILKY